MKKFSEFITIMALVLLTITSWKAIVFIKDLEVRVSRIEQTLQWKGASTVEIKVERAFDEDLRLWGYKLIGVEETSVKQIEEGGQSDSLQGS